MPALTPVLRFSIALLALANAATLHQIALSQSAENSANRLSSLPSTKTLVLTEEFHSEGAAIGDLDGDGNQDIISGPFYYRGPDFSERISYTPVKKYHIKQYSDHFFSFVFDFNSDGMLDILSIPIPGGKAIWFQNPGNRDQLWDSHLALNGVGNESPAFADLTGDGQPELVCIHQGEIGFASWNREEPSKPWTFRSATQGQRLGEFTHGLGVGDVNADGRLDLLETRGWWEQASEGTSFQFHPQQFSNSGGSQMFAYDLDGDGDQDVISVQNAHSYGLSWFERRGTGTDYLFVEHKILTGNPSENEAGVAISQMHSLALADLDGDGVQDILTGKRFFAHGGKDPGAFEPAFLLALRTVREQGRVRFEPHILSERSGVGTQLTVGDVDNNGTQDIVVGNKLGTFVTLNSGNLGPALPQSSEPYTRIGTRDFSVHVRETPARSPAEEAGLFRLPSGFEIKLVASEPDIAKPMNMAFDSLGRLWVSSSLEYPFAAPVNQLGRDTIKILEDTTGDGRADKITTFADGLNIPIGLYPYRDGVICFSIPNVLFLRDTNGDGHADQREILFGPMDTTRDTHGMCNGFTRGHDGWLYACHGFNNQSNITSRDGNQVVMHSGNTFRMRVDGSRLEHFTHGQVNPFGLSLDRWGDLFSADCHSKPVTLLLRDGYYDSFGKPHDGLGYVPEVMEHLHGSTGIGGIAVYDDVRFPEVYQGNVFGGNVMTGRVNRNSLQRIGSTLRAVEEPDFLIAGDPWFRPVDLQLGPDGALYVADFYNRIIGHYEVDLDHPGRDRHRGRIWKISYTGDSTLSERRDTKLKPHQPEPSHSSHQVQSIDEALVGLSDRNLTRQLLAANRIVDEYPGIAQQRIRPLLLDADPNLRLQAGWILHRLHMLQQTELASLIEDTNNLVRTHGFRILESDIGKQEHLQPSNHGPWIIQGLQDSAAMVQRAATMASITKPKQEFIAYILEAFTSTPITDKHLRHTLRMSLRTHLQNEAWFSELVPNLQEEEQRVAVLGVCLGIQSSVAARFVLDQLPLIGQAYPEELESYIAFAAKYVTPEDLNQLSQLVRNQFATDADYQERILRAALDGITPANSGEIPGPLRDWAKELALGRFGMKPGSDSPRFRKGQIPIAWSFHRYPDENEQEVENCWQFSTKRSSSDGEMNSLLFSSFPLGEKRRGIYRSAAFDLPADFSFFMAGHDGFPDKPIQRQNFVRLRDSSSQAGLALWRPPRNDTAQLFTLESPKLAGRSVYLELVDGDSAGAYAWLAVGRFSVAGLNPSETLADWRIAAELVRDFRLFALRPVVTELIMNSVQDPATSQMMAEAILATTRQRASAYQRALAICLGFPRVHGELRRRVLTELFDTSQGKGRLLDEISPLCTEVQQRHIATLLAEDRQGADHLLRLLESGKFATRLLLDAEILAKLKTRLSREQTERLSLLEGSIPKMQRRTRAAYERRIKELRSGLDAGLGNAADGRALFRKQCASCHRIGDEGKQVGPNLDGIGNRGLTRLTEDIFFPNRNVDVAFRATSILTHDDRVLSGLLRQTVDDQISLTDSQGTITRISANAIASRKQLLQSPMPGNFLETLSTQQSQDLFAFLLSLSQ